MTDHDAAVFGTVAGFLIGLGLVMFWSLSALVAIPVAIAVGTLLGFRFGGARPGARAAVRLRVLVKRN